MKSGSHNEYFWIQWENAFLDTLLQCVPAIVVGRFLVNTSYDSGSLTLAEEERQQGWRSVGALTYSPRITDVLSIPHDQFDEWLVFPEPTEVKTWQPIVNHCGFSMTDREFESSQEELWTQIEDVRPESYLAEGNHLVFITCSRGLHDLALAHTNLDTTTA